MKTRVDWTPVGAVVGAAKVSVVGYGADSKYVAAEEAAVVVAKKVKSRGVTKWRICCGREKKKKRAARQQWDAEDAEDLKCRSRRAWWEMRANVELERDEMETKSSLVSYGWGVVPCVGCDIYVVPFDTQDYDSHRH